MANPFSITPAGNYAQGLSGLADVLMMDEERQAERAAQEEAARAQEEAKLAMIEAYRSGDPQKMYEVALQYPSIGEIARADAGMMEDYQLQEGVDFATQVLSNPSKAGELAQARVENLSYLGRDPANTVEFLQTYQQDPEAALLNMEMWLAAANPEAREALQEVRAAQQKEEDVEAAVVGDYLVNKATGEVLFDASSPDGNASEHGLNPMVFRDPKTGAFTPFLPNKAGGMTQLQTPAGLEFVPDAGRLGYNPANILEQSEAKKEAENIANRPAAERLQARRQQQATLIDDTIDRALALTSNWSTGAGSYLKALPLTDARDLGALLDTIKANVGFEKLQEMREASPTGGALGAISDFENRMLQSVLSSLEQSQSPEQFKENLELVREQVRNIVHGSEQQFADTYQGAGATGTAAPRRRVYNQATGEIEEQ